MLGWTIVFLFLTMLGFGLSSPAVQYLPGAAKAMGSVSGILLLLNVCVSAVSRRA